MRFTWRSDERNRWRSRCWRESRQHPGVRFEIARISLARRGELFAALHSLVKELEFRTADNELSEQLRAGWLRTRINETYLRWGLKRVENLTIDGQPATAQTLIESGPESLCSEIVEAIRSECGLSEEERKN